MRKRHQTERKDAAGPAKESIKKQIAHTKRASAAAFAAMLDGELPEDSRAAARRAHLDAEVRRKELEATARAARVTVVPSRDEVAEMCREFTAGREEFTEFVDKRRFLERLVDRILVDRPEIEIHCRLQRPATAAGSPQINSHSGLRTDAERNDGDRHREKAGVAAKSSKCVADVLGQPFPGHV